MFADADVCWHPELVRGMMRTGLDVLIAPYPRKRIDWVRIEEHARNVARSLVEHAIGGGDALAEVEDVSLDLEAHGQSYPINFGADPSFDHETYSCSIDGGGIGCSIWSRRALEAIVARTRNVEGLVFDDGKKLEKPTVAVTSLIHDGRDLLSEDISLCRRARLAGLDVRLYLGPYSPASHVGPYLYQGKIEAFSQRGRQR
jgi:hypothetical protein